jgi:hypothetical protein
MNINFLSYLFIVCTTNYSSSENSENNQQETVVNFLLEKNKNEIFTIKKDKTEKQPYLFVDWANTQMVFFQHPDTNKEIIYDSWDQYNILSNKIINSVQNTLHPSREELLNKRKNILQKRLHVLDSAEDIRDLINHEIKDIINLIEEKEQGEGLCDKEPLNHYNGESTLPKYINTQKILYSIHNCISQMKRFDFFKEDNWDIKLMEEALKLPVNQAKKEIYSIKNSLMKDYETLTQPYELEELSEICKEVEKNDEKASSWWNNLMEIIEKLPNKNSEIEKLLEEKASIMIASRLITQSCELREKAL